MKILISVLLIGIVLTACSSVSDTSSVTSKSSQVEESMEQGSVESEEIKEEDSQTSMEEESVSIVKSGTITNGEYDVAAVVNLYSDNRLELIALNYNGGAPDVYIAIGTIENGSFQKSAILSGKITEKIENGSFEFMIEDGVDFNAVSVYCDAYSEDFGSTVLEEVE